jgi:hypothetical protein
VGVRVRRADAPPADRCRSARRRTRRATLGDRHCTGTSSRCRRRQGGCDRLVSAAAVDHGAGGSGSPCWSRRLSLNPRNGWIYDLGPWWIMLFDLWLALGRDDPAGLPSSSTDRLARAGVGRGGVRWLRCSRGRGPIAAAMRVPRAIRWVGAGRLACGADVAYFPPAPSTTAGRRWTRAPRLRKYTVGLQQIQRRFPVRRREGRARRARWWPQREGRPQRSPCLRRGTGRSRCER